MESIQITRAENQNSYYAIIPADVRYDRNLPDGAKLLYGEITALCNEKGYCWASNEYFLSLYHCGRNTISRWLRALKQEGYIQTELIYQKNSKEVACRNIYILPTKITGVIPKMGRGGIKNGADNNT